MRKSNYETKDLRLNLPVRGHMAGTVLEIKCVDGIPIDRYWRDRLKDSADDQCVEFVKKNGGKTK